MLNECCVLLIQFYSSYSLQYLFFEVVVDKCSDISVGKSLPPILLNYLKKR